MIDVKDLVKNYGPIRAVRGITFGVKPGEVVGLLGPNGAGKSTTLRVLTGYIPATAGLVRLADIDIRKNPLEARRRLGYLSESNPLYEALGVWESLLLAAGLRAIPPASVRKKIVDVVEKCGLQGVVGKDVFQLSKGYRQRLGLALAMIHDPEILILDEPTSALDPNQQKEVRDLILGLKEKKTVLLSTHILPEAENICDRLFIIHKGVITAEGTVDELQGRMAGEKSFFVRLEGPREEVGPALEKIPEVRVEFSDEKEAGRPGFYVSSSEDPRRALFDLTVKKGWPLMELRRKSATLDEIFQSLTKEN